MDSEVKLAILYICTGQYTVFWKDFYLSYEKYFMPDCKKVYYVFTDSDTIPFEKRDNVVKIYQKKLGWPFDTLMRFHIFLTIEEDLIKYDFIFFMNANCECVDYVSSKDVLKDVSGLIVVNHPGFWDKNNMRFTYERNENSKAFIPFGTGDYYVSGAVNGGTAQSYITMMKSLREAIDEDLKKNVIAIWHDESHLNRYVIGYNNIKVLGPEYFYPEGWHAPFSPKIISRDKSSVINVARIKGQSASRRLKNDIKILRRRLKKMIYRTIKP